MPIYLDADTAGLIKTVCGWIMVLISAGLLSDYVWPLIERRLKHRHRRSPELYHNRDQKHLGRAD